MAFVEGNKYLHLRVFQLPHFHSSIIPFEIKKEKKITMLADEIKIDSKDGKETP